VQLFRTSSRVSWRLPTRSEQQPYRRQKLGEKNHRANQAEKDAKEHLRAGPAAWLVCQAFFE
jgi:hypothetical protein